MIMRCTIVCKTTYSSTMEKLIQVIIHLAIKNSLDSKVIKICAK